jgi:hypothetical protein
MLMIGNMQEWHSACVTGGGLYHHVGSDRRLREQEVGAKTAEALLEPCPNHPMTEGKSDG